MNERTKSPIRRQSLLSFPLSLVDFGSPRVVFETFRGREGVTEEGRKKRRRGILRCSKRSTRESQNCVGTTTATNGDGVVVLKSFGNGVSGRSHLHCSSFCCNSSSTPYPGTRATASRELLVSSFSFLFLYATLCFSGSVSLFLQCE
jgi:hypothetical protein